MHEIHTRHHLGHRVLDLKARVHLEEIEVALGVHEELDGARVDVAGGAREPAGRLAHARAQARVHERRRALLDQLLVTPLDGALALAEVDDVVVGVGEDLDLDVPRLGDGALEVDGRVAEGGAGLGARRAQRLREVVLAAHEPHALAAAAHGGLEHHRIADLARDPGGLDVARHGLEGAGHHRHTQLTRELAGRRLTAHPAHRRRRRADEGQPGGRARLRERRVLGEEPVPRVHGVGARAPRRLHEAVDHEVALGGGGGTDRVRLVGHLHVQRLAVGLREDGDGRDAQLAARAQHADGDLAAVGDEQLLDLHAGRLLTGRP